MIHMDISEDVKFKLADLISNVGSVLGLFLGKWIYRFKIYKMEMCQK